MLWVTATLTLVRAAQRSLSADLEARACCPRGELAAPGLQAPGTVPQGKGKGPLCCHIAGLSPGGVSVSAERQWEKWELEAVGDVAVRHLAKGQHFALAFSLADT